jgi:type IV pilus assembly protein PilQ
MIQMSNQVKTRVVLVTLLFLFTSVVLIAQTPDLRQKRVSISAEEASVSSILTTLASLSGANIVVAADPARDGETTHPITVNLRDVPVEQALNLIVRSAGLSYRFVGENTFLVGPRERIREEVGERSYIINLNNVNAEKIQKSFETFGGRVTAIEGQNALMVFANPETYAEIIQRVEEMDVPQQQIEIRARLIEISINDTKKLGIDWSRLNKLTTIIAENPVTYSGVGLPWNYANVDDNLPHGQLADLYKLPESQYFQKIDGFNDVGYFSRQLTAFDITLDWLLENNAAQLLVDTRITALNGEFAEIFNGEIIPYITSANTEAIQVEREETGIKLGVKPSINKDGQITANIAPEVSSIIGLIGGTIPHTKQRKINTTVTVPNGQKIHVGGLLSSNLVTTTNKVPFLGDIPFIGRLFQHKYTEIRNTDLVIEITPRVINLADEQYDYELDSRLGRELIKKKTDEDQEVDYDTFD